MTLMGASHTAERRGQIRLLAPLVVALLLFSSCSSEPEYLVIGYQSENPGPIMAEAIADVLNEAGIAVKVHENVFLSKEESMAKVEGRVVDIALLEEPLTPNHNLRMLLPIYPSVLHAFYRSDKHSEMPETPIVQNLLNARSIYPGPPGSAGARLAVEFGRHFLTHDIQARLLSTPWVAPPAPPPQAYLIFGDLLTPEARLGLASYTMFSFDEDSGGSAEALALLFPNLRPYTLPAGIYPTLAPEPVTTLALETLLVARPDLDTEVAYGIIEALRARPQPLEQAYAFSRESFQRDIDNNIHTLALHDGARRYINKDAPSFLERYAEVLALLATLMVAGGTMLTTWLRQRRQRRKDRLDEYFLRLQRLRVAPATNSAPNAAPDSADVAAQVAELEEEVLQLLVQERLAVDAALVSFFLLSESVRRQTELTASRSEVP